MDIVTTLPKVRRSANSDAVISVNSLTRRIVVTSLVKMKNYVGIGCRFVKCPYPQRKCVECLHKFANNNVVF